LSVLRHDVLPRSDRVAPALVVRLAGRRPAGSRAHAAAPLPAIGASYAARRLQAIAAAGADLATPPREVAANRVVAVSGTARMSTSPKAALRSRGGTRAPPRASRGEGSSATPGRG